MYDQQLFPKDLVMREIDYWQLGDPVHLKEVRESEDSSHFGYHLSLHSLAVVKKRNDNRLYHLLKKQICSALEHAAARGKHKVTLRFTHQGQTFFGTVE